MDSMITNPEQTQENTIASQDLQGETDLIAEHVFSTQYEDKREPGTTSRGEYIE